jgi:hypothetical protein
MTPLDPFFQQEKLEILGEVFHGAYCAIRRLQRQEIVAQEEKRQFSLT